jgi:nicotinamidase-related amidase
MNKDSAAIVLIDHQIGTVSWIQSQPKEMVIANTRLLARLGAELQIPHLITSTMEEQVGVNIADLKETAPLAYEARVKRGGTLNTFLDPKFREAVRALNRKTLIMAGLTTDICLFHSVVGALKEGYEVQVVADACGSMTTLADASTFDRLRGLGVVVTGGNQVLSELFTDFGTAEGQRAMKINLDEIVSKLGK